MKAGFDRGKWQSIDKISTQQLFRGMSGNRVFRPWLGCQFSRRRLTRSRLTAIYNRNRQSLRKATGFNLTMEVADIKREVEMLSDRLGKTQDYL